MAEKPTNARGTRDFGPEVVLRRRYLQQTLQQAFERYGYRPIETPALENLKVLEGKYGEEGDRLLFRILNSGDYLKDASLAQLAALAPEAQHRALLPHITEKALRYDLTVPFARYVVQHQHTLTLPFKRYQMQPVWRADRPQKGRYREFVQCDADVVGSRSLVHEVEFVQLYAEVFTALGLRVTLQVNHRKVLTGMAEVIGAPERVVDFTVALDKLDKIGEAGVLAELAQRGFTEAQCQAATAFFALQGSVETALAGLEAAFRGRSETGLAGVAELRQLVAWVAPLPLGTATLALNVTLARGLNYYTGCIFEVKSDEVTLGSIGGGGRYDDLTGLFGLPGLSGAGISFGLDRIYDVVDELGRWPTHLATYPVAVLVANFGEAYYPTAFALVRALRAAGHSAELYPEPKKLAKQLEYANKCGIPYVLLYGEAEANHQEVIVKVLATGNQVRVPLAEMLSGKGLVSLPAA
ncbi:MAG: histidine--tRNA ligase [Bacteroidia bacterium]|nr:histidine--tRNA ligase [Bacteroidia bacterium]